MIEVKNIRKSFGKVKALDGVTFSAPNGQITGLLGPNGAGKTTALRILYTLLGPDEGTARIDEFDVVTQRTEVQRRLGALPHAHGLYSRLTGKEHIRYYGRLHGLTGKRLEQRIDTLVETLDMHDIVDRKTAGFSEGQRVKVAIARALVHDPQNVLFDEPTAGLDVMSTRKMRGLIRGLRDQGRCVLFSSHIMQEVSELCDHIVVLSKGRVVARGSPDELRESTGCENLEDAFVAAIGTEEGLG